MLRGSRLLLAALVAAAGAALASPDGAWAGTWCGTDAVDTNRLPEYAAGNQVHVVYAFPADGADRFAEAASAIVTDLEHLDAWWRGQDPTRAPRFDVFPFPNCASPLGGLDLTKVRLPQASSAYSSSSSSSLGRIANDIFSSAFGAPAEYSKYLVYYDGPVDFVDTCGIAQTPPVLTRGQTTAAVFLHACEPDLGSGGYTAWTAAHELMHNLGAVQVGGPGTCGGGGHTCDDDQDLMGRFVNSPLSSAILDVGRDDYYGHSGSWLDIQDSPWLFRLGAPRPVLDVVLTRAAAGSLVESSPPGISCPALCRNEWDPGAAVALTATPARGQRLVRWEGACSGRAAVCSLTLGASTAATAVFGPASFRLSLAVSGRGLIRTSLGRACARSCPTTVAADRVVRLRAQPRPGQRFVRWSGACRGKKLTCTVTMSANRSVRATFARR